MLAPDSIGAGPVVIRVPAASTVPITKTRQGVEGPCPGGVAGAILEVGRQGEAAVAPLCTGAPQDTSGAISGPISDRETRNTPRYIARQY